MTTEPRPRRTGPPRGRARSSDARPALVFHAWTCLEGAELRLWQQLSRALGRLDIRLVVLGPLPPRDDLRFEYHHFPGHADWFERALPPQLRSSSPSGSLHRVVRDAMRIDAVWRADRLRREEVARRRRSLSALADWTAALLTAVGARAVVVWNGLDPAETLLRGVAGELGLPTLVAERGPFAETLFVDPDGTSASSAVTRLRAARWLNAAERRRGHARLDALAHWMARRASTWWKQPARQDVSTLRERLQIAPGRQVVLFAGQLDRDTQNLFFSPRFAGTADAWRWLTRRGRLGKEWFLLGKQHPLDASPPGTYRSPPSGAWIADLSIFDALAMADRVVTVNSTVAFEALLRGLPTLVMGQWVFSRWRVAYELATGRETSVVADWLAARGHAAQQRRWRDAMAFLLERAVYGYGRGARAAGLRDADALAQDLATVLRFQGALPVRIGQHWPLAVRWLTEGAAALDARTVGLEGARRELAECRRHLGEATLDATACRLLATREETDLFVWGTGQGARLAATWLSQLGLDVAGFVSNHTPHDATPLGRPLLSPSSLTAQPRAVVVVASAFAREIVDQLRGLGLDERRGYVVIDPDELLRRGLVAT